MTVSVDVVGLVVGALSVCFLAWAVDALRRRYRAWGKASEDRFFLENVGKYYGLEMKPGEGSVAFRKRLDAHVRGDARYPREPV